MTGAAARAGHSMIAQFTCDRGERPAREDCRRRLPHDPGFLLPGCHAVPLVSERSRSAATLSARDRVLFLTAYTRLGLIYFMASRRTEHSSHHSATRRREVEVSRLDGLHLQGVSLRESGELFEFCRAAVETVRVPGNDATDLPGAHGVKHGAVLRSRSPARGTHIVVDEDRDDLPPETFSERATVRLLPVYAKPRAGAIPADAGVDPGCVTAR